MSRSSPTQPESQQDAAYPIRPLTPPPRAGPLRDDLHARYASSTLSSPTTPRTPIGRTQQGRTYSPFTPSRGKADEVIQLNEVGNETDSPFHDSMAWDSTWVEPDARAWRYSRQASPRKPSEAGRKAALLDALGIDPEYALEDTQVRPQRLSFGSSSVPPPANRESLPFSVKSVWIAPRPSTRLMFSVIPREDYIFHILPCVILAATSALVTPYMTVVIGDAFEIYSAFPTDISTLQPGQSKAFLAAISTCAIKLAVAGSIGLVLNVAMVGWWVCLGEKVANCVRAKVYQGVMGRSMAWFDLGMGMKTADGGPEGGETKEEAIGAGGLMGKFARETDDVRIACGRIMGLAVQAVAIFLSCLALALAKSWKLSLVTLSALPVIVGVQIVVNTVVNPLIARERRAFAEASTNIERTTNVISTVKAFNAQRIEGDRFNAAVERAKKTLCLQSVVWGLNLGSSQFILLAMFILGFWYGAKLVRSGEASVGNVMTVFWACLLAGSALQGLIPDLVYIQHGKTSMASLMTLALSPDEAVTAQAGPPQSPSSSMFGGGSAASSPTRAKHSEKPRVLPKQAKKPISLQRIRPEKTRGEITFSNVSFAYPSRPEAAALDAVSMFLPAGETTFIVGGSGSGKSTVAQLLLQLYAPDAGEILLDDQDITYLDVDYTREVISAVQQGCILFDASVEENVAMGLAGSAQRNPRDAQHDKIVEACRMAMIDDFIDSLPRGYATMLGPKGASLSGGQRQRLGIARARLRDPNVLILDEATSALDPTSRIQVFEAIRRWRKNRTTIVITHDLSQITPHDFIYVMKDGQVVEQGYRADLIGIDNGEFGRMTAMQAIAPLPEDDAKRWHGADEVEEILDDADIDPDTSALTFLKPRPNSRNSIRPPSVGFLAYLDVLSEYATRESFVVPPNSSTKRMTMSQGIRPVSQALPSRPLSHMTMGGWPRASFIDGQVDRPSSRLSTTWTDSRKTIMQQRLSYLAPLAEDGEEPGRHIAIDKGKHELSDLPIDNIQSNGQDGSDGEVAVIKPPSALTLIRRLYPSVPRKWMLFLGVVCSIAHGVMTPLWAKYIAVLMAEVSNGGADGSALATTALIVLAISAGDGLAVLGQFFFLDCVAAIWATLMRKQAFDLVLRQPQKWFDQRDNAASRLVQILIKDADDMRPLMSMIIGRALTVGVMLALGLTWAMAIGWRMTLVGLALAPVFALVFTAGSHFINVFERRNKLAREALSRLFYESLANVRSIRAMAMESTFQDKFATSRQDAWSTGVVAATANALSHGSSVSLPFYAQALLIWVSAIFMAKGYYTYATVLQIYALVLFTVTWAAQAMDFIPLIAKSNMAASDFDRLTKLPTMSEESQGELRFPITGQVSYKEVSFAYPSRPDVPILRGITLDLQPAECVAIVGPSGSGKSTIAALLQRLYEPSSGSISMDRYKLAQADVRWLRDHVAVVSQQANLFDGTVTENIAYGSPNAPRGEIERAARAANVHDFILSLPQGYDTNLGENASLISGGQAQRLQIARALVKRSSILLLDECTSALDPENQEAILNTIMQVKQSRTTIFITHKADVMQRCDRVICLAEGRIAEDGPYDELIARGGAFSQLMKAGEWE